jgi:Cysteine-rich secretory protein family
MILTGFNLHPFMKFTGKCLAVAVFCVYWLTSNVDGLAATHSGENLAKGSASHSALEKGILAEMNKARANPTAYAQTLKDWRKRFSGRRARLAPHLFLETKEGVRAVDEAIAALTNISPVPKLRSSSGLTAAAREHVTYQGQRGLVGHRGKNSSTPFERMNRHGRWLQVAGENISYGASSPIAVVRDLIVDDGVPDRGHRVNMFRKDYRVTGVACGPHKTYRIMCVIGYAAGYQEKN